MAVGGAPLNFKNNNQLFYYSFYGFGLFYLALFYFLFDRFPIKGLFPVLLTGILSCFIFSFSIKYFVERFIQKRKASIFLQK